MVIQEKSESPTDLVAGQLGDISNRLRLVEIDVAVLKSSCATRDDIAKTNESIARLEIKTQESINALDARTQASFHTQDNKIAQLEVRMTQTESRLIRWFVGTAITLSTVVGTIAFTAAKFIH